MRKLMLMAAMLAMVLVAAAPALAQDAVAGDVDESVNDSFNTDIQYADCDAVQDAAVNQYGGDAEALGDAAAASVANEVGVSQETVLACIGSTAAGDDVGGDEVVVVEENGVDDDADGVVDEAGEAAAVAGAAAGAEAAGAEAAGAATLPDTGGASLFTLGAGALLVGGGLLARRIFR